MGVGRDARLEEPARRLRNPLAAVCVIHRQKRRPRGYRDDCGRARQRWLVCTSAAGAGALAGPSFGVVRRGRRGMGRISTECNLGARRLRPPINHSIYSGNGGRRQGPNPVRVVPRQGHVPGRGVRVHLKGIVRSRGNCTATLGHHTTTGGGRRRRSVWTVTVGRMRIRLHRLGHGSGHRNDEAMECRK